MASCPHCNEALSGFLDQATHEKRLKAKSDAIAVLEAQVKGSQADLAGVKDAVAERDSLRAELTGMKRQLAMSNAGITDPAVARVFEVMYDAMDADEEGAKPEFGDLASWAATNPVLAAYVKTGEEAPEGSEQPKQERRETTPPRTPARHSGQEPPPPQGKMTAQQVRQFFRSPEFQAMTPEQQEQKMNELQAEHV